MQNNISILDYKNEIKDYFKILNEEWLNEYFTIEESDHIQLGDPQKHIIDKGGKIFFAKYNNEIAGTVSLMRINEQTYELGKMAVTEKFRGKGIGKLLIEYSIKEANRSGLKRIILYSNTKLSPAIHLYKKYGFKEVLLTNSVYKRSDIKMELKLK
jgi:GNAT superfamily N-acetyltransferase